MVSWVTATNKYEVDDIDAEEGKERHVLSKRRIVPLPLMKANPETDPDALFQKVLLLNHQFLSGGNVCIFKTFFIPSRVPW